MIANFILFAAAHQFVTGLIIGAISFGGALGTIGWCLGYEAAMRKVGSWMRTKKEEVHGDMPNLPPVRDRRFNAIVYRSERLS